MGASFHIVTCGSLRPFPLHAARVRVRGALFFGDFLLAKQKKVTSCQSATGEYSHPLIYTNHANSASITNTDIKLRITACRTATGIAVADLLTVMP